MMVPRKSFAEGVERAGADIAEDDTDRADDQLGRGFLAGMTMPFLLAVFGDGDRADAPVVAADRDGAAGGNPPPASAASPPVAAVSWATSG